jgi:hypothetical protein
MRSGDLCCGCVFKSCQAESGRGATCPSCEGSLVAGLVAPRAHFGMEVRGGGGRDKSRRSIGRRGKSVLMHESASCRRMLGCDRSVLFWTFENIQKSIRPLSVEI